MKLILPILAAIFSGTSLVAIASQSPVVAVEKAAQPQASAPVNTDALAIAYLDFMRRAAKHSEQIWPGFSLQDKVHFFSAEGRVWLQRPGSPVIQDESVLDAVNLQTGNSLSIGFPEYQEQPGVLLQVEQTLAMFADDEALSAVGLLNWAGGSIHEAFHYYGQAQWSVLDMQVQLKGEVYPLSTNARYARAMLLQALLAAVVDKEQRSSLLGQAVFWLNRWRGQAPLEDQVGFGNDLIEGTAAYVTLVSGALAAAQMQADLAGTGVDVAENTHDADVDGKTPRIEYGPGYRDYLIRFIQGFYRQATLLGWDAEAQYIGALAGVLLDLSRDPAMWKEAAAEGVLPLDMLLGQVNMIRPELPDDPRVWQQILATFDYYPATNRRLAGLLAELDNPRVPLLVVPTPVDSAQFVVQGEVRSGLYVVPFQDGVVQAYLGVNTQIDNMNFMNTAFIELSNQHYCEELENVALIPLTGKHSVQGEYLVLEHPELQGMIRMTSNEIDGRTLYCAAP
jgi:hypothetical protein